MANEENKRVRRFGRCKDAVVLVFLTFNAQHIPRATRQNSDPPVSAK